MVKHEIKMMGEGIEVVSIQELFFFKAQAYQCGKPLKK
jgi:hypothetical protein